MSGEIPALEELLAEARRTLAEEVAPRLSGSERFKTLMAANAIGIALRELAASADEAAAGQCLAAAERDALCAAIRRGREDGSPAVHDRLLRDAAFRRRFSA